MVRTGSPRLAAVTDSLPELDGTSLGSSGLGKPMKRQPWFKFFASDFLLDEKVDALSLECQGLLVRMWCLCHMEGSCPASAKELARKTLCQQHCVQQCLPHCLPFFEKRDGRLYSHRMEAEKGKSEIARTYANLRWNAAGNATGNALGNAERNPQSQSQSQSQKSESKSKAGEAPPDELPIHNYAFKLCEDLSLTQSPSYMRAIGGNIEILLREGRSRPAAYEFLKAKALDAKDAGIVVDKWFFEDQKWRNGFMERRQGYESRDERRARLNEERLQACLERDEDEASEDNG